MPDEDHAQPHMASTGGEPAPKVAADVPRIENWRIDRSGTGLRIRGSKIGRINATHVICAAGTIFVMRDADCIGVLLT